jgi:hypothetical protein
MTDSAPPPGSRPSASRPSPAPLPAPRAGSAFGELSEVVTIGLPFCVFKALVGALLLRRGHTLGGGLLLALGSLDTLVNSVNFLALLAVGRRLWSPCSLSLLTERSGLFSTFSNDYLRDLGTSLDVLLSFTLVAAMVGFGLLGSLPAAELTVWNAAVVLNVLGAGLSRVGATVRSARR